MSTGVGGGGSSITTDHSRLYFLNSPSTPLTARDPFFIKPEYLNYENPMHHLYPSNRGLIDYNNYTSAAVAAASGSTPTNAVAPVAALNLENTFQQPQSQQSSSSSSQQPQATNSSSTTAQQQTPQNQPLPLPLQLSTPPSTRAQKAARRRSNESIEARQRRLARNASRMREKRAKETEEEYRIRLAKNAEANRIRRQNENEVQRTLRLMKNAARQRLRRASETPEERKKRLAKAAERMRTARANAPKVYKPPLEDRLKGY
ncbi:uncharacterized protein C05D11.13 [Eurosta solidaginis]|uniref:uncharacterized protein C05D11.13 n=1 Tax=Eurosta solidaginis TaxID=178769 RepID=UPI003530780D